MKLAIIEIDRSNNSYKEYKLFNTDEELLEIEKEYKDRKENLYNSSGFVGYFNFYINVYEDFSYLTLNDLSNINIKMLVNIFKAIGEYS